MVRLVLGLLWGWGLPSPRKNTVWPGRGLLDLAPHSINPMIFSIEHRRTTRSCRPLWRRCYQYLTPPGKRLSSRLEIDDPGAF